MCCLKRPKKVQRKYRRKSVVHPENIRKRRNAVDAEFMDMFVKEVIYCGGCKEPFNLDSNKLKIHCNICNQFFHCKIAGECLGKDCKVENIDGTIHRASYCYDCVGKVYENNTCLCRDCFND